MNEQTYLESILVPLLANPKDLKVEHQVDEKGILLTVKAHSSDMGRIIGKAGSTANSVRNLVRQYGALHQQHISVKISDPEGYVKPLHSTSDRDMLK